MAEAKAEFRKKLADLRAKYVAQLKDRLDEVEAAFAPLKGELPLEKTVEALERLHHLTHKLVGSGTLYGFPELSETARQIEYLCDAILGIGQEISAQQRREMDDLVRGLWKTVSPSDEPSQTDVSVGQFVQPEAGNAVLEKAGVLIVGADGAWAAALTGDLSNYGFSAKVLSAYSDLADVVSTEPPSAIIVDMDFDDDGNPRIEIVQRLREERGADCPLIFLGSRGDLGAYVAAVREGADAYLPKPVNIAELVDALDGLVVSDDAEPYRILVVDDDPSVALYVEAVLQKAGMNTLVLNAPMEVLGAIEEFTPELILLDMYMPDCNGQELAAAIRLQPAYTGIPIVFLSGESDRDKQMKALTHGGDDFLTKTIRPEHLIASIRTRVQRFRALRSLMVRDSMTGLFNHTTTNEMFEAELGRAKRHGSVLALAALDIDHFKSVNDTYGHGVGDLVIKSLARLLKQRLRSTDIIGRMGGEEFSAILSGVDGPTAEKIMNDIRQAFSEIQHHTEQGAFSVTMSCGIADFPRFETQVQLSEVADKALYAAKNGGRNRVVLVEARVEHRGTHT
jgi:diguanylate cyclase (GGDEF)-like protein